ncbi:MAG: hypothetical protein CVU41_16105 [Chloroflexi bacterium HGW-Chloroflexi-3]|nr:MAG: hypothetical protein CVU41_16105 [Chloroflexi bacterium HGW-Chloroflexi-3]
MNPIILVVDDEPIGLATIQSLLDGEEYCVETAQNGKEALAKADALTPDLVLLDVMMPGMDGFEVCRRLRSDHRLGEVPIIILTALDDRASLLRGLESGADDFLTKPVDGQELRTRVRTIVRLNRYRTLLQQRESLREMAEHVVTAQEQERQRISRELHDDLGQTLTALILNLRKTQKSIDPANQVLHDQLGGLITDTNEAISKVRSLAQGLRPPMLDALGINQALTNYCDEFSQRMNIPINVQIDKALDGVSDLHSIVLYRVLQEALTNITKHAQATEVWVELASDEGALNLTVQDNGQGMRRVESDGIGILGMKERLALIGGELILQSTLGNGTILTARLPIKERSL